MVQDPRTWIEISSSALRYNYRQFRRLVGSQVGILPVLKANAYGHGAVLVARALRGLDTWGFGVAHGDEALHLIDEGIVKRLLVLTSWRSTELPALLKSRVQLVVWDSASLRQVRLAARRVRQVPKIHIKLDTGTTRIGFLATDLPKLRTQLKDDVNVQGIFSHLAHAEENSTNRTQQQIKRFATLSQDLHVGRGIRHLACTAAIIRYPEAHFWLVRLGIGLYGYWPSEQIQRWAVAHRVGLRLRPVLHWRTRLTQTKEVPAGTGIGYGSTVVVKRKTRIGIIPVGYFDGIDRKLSNRGWVSIHGQRAPILGRVCMNLTIVDLTRISASAGDPVTIIGPGAQADKLAEAIDTIPYEILSRINPIIERRLV